MTRRARLAAALAAAKTFPPYHDLLMFQPAR